MWETFLKHKALISIISLGFAAFLTVLSWNIRLQVRDEQQPFKEEMFSSIVSINKNIKSLKELSILQEEKMQEFSSQLMKETRYLNDTLRVEVQRNAELKADKLDLTDIKHELGKKVSTNDFWHAITDINNRLDTFEIGSAVHGNFHEITHIQEHQTNKNLP